MNLEETMGQLEEMGTAQNRKVYTRHGVRDQMFGVSYANLNRLARTIKRDHSLACQLWETGNHDAQVLATKVADPALADGKLLDDWVADLDSYVISDAFAGLVGNSPFARAKAEEWSPADGEWRGRAGWLLVANLAMKDTDLPDDYFLGVLETIQQEIHQRRNRVRDAMNWALIAIGIRNDSLEAAALQTAALIGKVEVDHGQTNCKTPDAADYIRRTLDRKKEKGSKGKRP